MKRILIVMTAIALAAISYGPVAALWGTADPLGNAQCPTTVESTAIATYGSIPSGLFYLCADDAATEEEPAEEEKPAGCQSAQILQEAGLPKYEWYFRRKSQFNDRF